MLMTPFFICRLKDNRQAFFSVLKEEVRPEDVNEQVSSAVQQKEHAVRASREALEKCKQERASYDIRIDGIQAQLQKHQSMIEGI